MDQHAYLNIAGLAARTGRAKSTLNRYWYERHQPNMDRSAVLPWPDYFLVTDHTAHTVQIIAAEGSWEDRREPVIPGHSLEISPLWLP